jgi:hypothetical protein
LRYDHSQSVKEVIRHVLFRCGLARALDVVRHWRGQATQHLLSRDITDVFSQIYRDDIWVAHESQGGQSGIGSTPEATRDLIAQLSALLENVGCRQLVDVGCGDFDWMKNLDGDFDYLGIDVVPWLVEANNDKYASAKRRFICVDATREPIGPGDVALCREILFHLSFLDGKRLLRNIKAGGFKYVLITNDKSVWFNSDIRNGDFRRINLTKAPYRFPEPQCELTDDKVFAGRVLAVWPGTALPD